MSSLYLIKPFPAIAGRTLRQDVQDFALTPICKTGLDKAYPTYNYI